MPEEIVEPRIPKPPVVHPWEKVTNHIIAQKYTDVNAELFDDMLPTIFPVDDIEHVRKRLRNRRSAIMNMVKADLQAQEAESTRENIQSLLSSLNAEVLYLDIDTGKHIFKVVV